MRISRSLFVALALLVTPMAALAAGAEPGTPAPDFTLKGIDGKSVHLSELKGKLVVLEWFNPECPFVRAAHTKGSLVDMAKHAAARGIVWLAINSNAPGKQGSGIDKNQAGQKAYGLQHPILLDEAGTVGKAYGASNTPHLFVLDKNQRVAYRGAIDNSPDGEGASPQGGKLVNYVEQALDDLAAGRPVRTASTKAYGCTVKY